MEGFEGKKEITEAEKIAAKTDYIRRLKNTVEELVTEKLSAGVLSQEKANEIIELVSGYDEHLTLYPEEDAATLVNSMINGG